MHQFTGISDPWQGPQGPDGVTDATDLSAEEAVHRTVLRRESQEFGGVNANGHECQEAGSGGDSLTANRGYF